MENLIKLDDGNVERLASFLFKVNSIQSLLNFQTKLKFRNKPWITLRLQISIFIKNHLLIKYIKSKDVTLTNKAQIRYRYYRNLLSTLMKGSRTSNCTNYLQNNLNNLKSTWKGVKNLISLKKFSNAAPSNIFDNGQS